MVSIMSQCITPFLEKDVDISSRFGEIKGYLERQYDDILAEESRIKRNPRFRYSRDSLSISSHQILGTIASMSSSTLSCPLATASESWILN